jgi:zinc protease
MKSLLIALFLLIAAGAPARAADHLLDIIDRSESGGYQLWVLQDKSLPLISVEFAIVGGGSRNDPADKQGVRQLLSNTLDEGAGEYDAKTFQNLLADHSINLRFWNSRDAFGATMYTLSSHKDLAFDLLDAALNKPTFADEAVERMRAANLTRLRGDSADPEWMAARLYNATLFKGHAYSQNSGGTLKSLADLKVADLKEAHQSLLSRPAVKVAIAGDITPEEAQKRVEQIIKTWRKAPIPDTLPQVVFPDKAQTVLFKQDIPQTIVEIALPGIPRSDPDFAAAIVMNHIFGGGGFGSKLTELIREKEGLTYGIYSSVQTLDKAPLIGISTSTRNEVAGTLVSHVKDVMAEMRKAPADQKTLDDAKAYLTGSLPLDMTSLKSTSKLMSGLQQEDLPADYLDTYVTQINAVTPADIQRLAQRLLQPERMQVVLVGQPQKIKPTATVDTIPGVKE